MVVGQMPGRRADPKPTTCVRDRDRRVVAQGRRLGVEVRIEQHVAADLEAGFAARDVPVAGAERVANLDVSDRLGNRQIGRLSAANDRKSGGGAEK